MGDRGGRWLTVMIFWAVFAGGGLLGSTGAVLAACPSGGGDWLTGEAGGEGCSPPVPLPARPPQGPLVSPSPRVFSHSLTYTINLKRGEGGKKALRRAVAVHVARRLFGRVMGTRSPEEEALAAAIRRLSQTPLSLHVVRYSETLFDVTATANVLNRIARLEKKAVESKVAEYKIANVSIEGGSPRQNAFVRSHLPIGADGVTNTQTLDSRLYEIGQLPGFDRVDALFFPTSGPDKEATAEKNRSPFAPVEGDRSAFSANGGTYSDTEDLLLKIVPQPTLTGSQVEIDNDGYAPTGAVVLNATGVVNEAFVPGGQFTVNASTSVGMNSGTLSYQLPVPLSSLRETGGVDLSAVSYRLGSGISPFGTGESSYQLTALGVQGANAAADVWLMQAPIEKNDRSLSFRETLFGKTFSDSLSRTVMNVRTLEGATLGVSGSRTAGSLSASFFVNLTAYDLSPAAGDSPLNPYYVSTAGLQTYGTAGGSLQWTLSPPYSLTLATSDQQYVGGGQLDPMMQAVLGGPANLMALPTASLFGSDLYFFSLTGTRRDGASFGTFASSVFVDAGEVRGIGTAASAAGPGVEESFDTGHRFFAKLDLAAPLGALPTEYLSRTLPALMGGNLSQGGIMLQCWLSLGVRY